jgi:hypothetical protein
MTVYSNAEKKLVDGHANHVGIRTWVLEESAVDGRYIRYSRLSAIGGPW